METKQLAKEKRCLFVDNELPPYGQVQPGPSGNRGSLLTMERFESWRILVSAKTCCKKAERFNI